MRLWAVGWMTGTMMWLELLVVALVALELTGSPFLVSVMFFLRFVPMLFGFGIGVLAERFNRKYLMILGLAVQAGTSLWLGLLITNDSLQYWQLALGNFVIGAVMASEFPIRRTMIGEVVPKTTVGRAISLEQSTNSLFRIPGPFIGGVFLATIGAQGGFFLGVALYSVGLLIALSLKYERPASSNELVSPVTQVIEGVRYISKSQLMVGTLAVTLILNMFGFSYLSQQPVVVKQVLEVGEVLIGVLQSVEGAGAFVGASLIAMYAQPRQYPHIFMWGSSLYLVAILLFSQSEVYWLTLIIMFIGGIGMSGFATMQSAIMIYTSSPEMRGRALGSIAVFIGLGPFGQLGIGALASVLDPATAVLIVSGIGIALMAVAFILIPAMRTSRSMKDTTA